MESQWPVVPPAGGASRFGLDTAPSGDGSTVVITVTGELDFTTAPVLATAVSQALVTATAGVAVRLDQLSFVDSSGLGAMVQANRSATRLGKTFCLVSPPPLLTQLLGRTGLDRVLVVEPSPLPDRTPGDTTAE